MKIGYTGWTWLSDEFNNWAPKSNNPKGDFEQFLKDVSDLGFQTVENFDFMIDYYKDDEAGLKALCEKYNVEFANLYFYFTNDAEADYKKALRCVDFMKKIGATYMNAQGVMWEDAPLNREMDKEKTLDYAKRADKIGKLCYENGIKLCLHPHACTNIYHGEEIDYFLENTNPKYVSLCLDTAHLKLAGMNPAEKIIELGDRIGYIHLKDLDPNENLHPEWPLKRFVTLGHGTIDFKAVMRALDTIKYDDIVGVEIDYQKVCNYKTAMECKQYLHSALGLM